MKYAIHDGNGQIFSVGFGPESMLEVLTDAYDFVHILPNDSACADNTHYIDMVLQEAVAMPERTSKHHVFDYTAKAWVDPRSLDDLKAEKRAEINLARNAAEYGGFTWSGHAFDSDQVSTGRITGAVSLAMMAGSEFSIDWTLADNTVVTLSQADMLAVGAALGAHVGLQHDIARGLKAQVTAATTAAEVEAISW